MYRDTIRCGAHKCLASERQETVLRPWKGMTLLPEERTRRKKMVKRQSWLKQCECVFHSVFVAVFITVGVIDRVVESTEQSD